MFYNMGVFFLVVKTYGMPILIMWCIAGDSNSEHSGFKPDSSAFGIAMQFLVPAARFELALKGT